MGLTPTILTGDNPRTAAAIAGSLGTNHADAAEDKLTAIREMMSEGGVMMSGDGINDAGAEAGQRRCDEDQGPMWRWRLLMQLSCVMV